MGTQSHDMTSLQERLSFIGLDRAAMDTLRSLKPVIAASVEEALEGFYAKVRQTPEVRRFFSDERHVSLAKGRQASHWGLIAEAAFDEKYVTGVSSVGHAHARLGLEPRWYIGGYALIVEQLVGAVVHARLGTLFGRAKAQQLTREVGVIVKAAMLDMDYAISVYLGALKDARTAAEEEKARVEAGQRRALALLAEALDALAGGDLEGRLTEDLPQEFVAMAFNFNRAAEALHEAIAEVRQTSNSIMAGADGIAGASEDLSRRTEQQAASLEQSAAALHQLSESVRLTADSASRATQVVASTQQEAAHSGQVVADAVGAMGQIKTSSEQIAAIIGVIDEIAFQTNLLALNAGVEAARAGEAGRGFAVVAQEVRSLAQRCASSAREIKNLISTSGVHVANGVGLVGAAGEALSRMIGRINEISDLMSGIASAAREQSQGLGEVNVAVSQMDQITQKNAAMVEETSAETQRLRREASELTGKLERFRVAAARGRVAHLQPAMMADTAARRPVETTGHALAPQKRVANGSDGWEEF